MNPRLCEAGRFKVVRQLRRARVRSSRGFFCVSPLQHCPGNIYPPQRRHIRTHLQSKIIVVVEVAAMAEGEAAMTLHAPAMWVFILSLVLAVLGSLACSWRYHLSRCTLSGLLF